MAAPSVEAAASEAPKIGCLAASATSAHDSTDGASAVPAYSVGSLACTCGPVCHARWAPFAAATPPPPATTVFLRGAGANGRCRHVVADIALGGCCSASSSEHTQWRSLSRDEKGRRLIQAAQGGETEELRALLAAGADVGSMDGDRRTALQWAVWEGHEEAVTYLLESGAEVNARNVRHNTPLHSAASVGHAAVVRLLMRASADANIRNLSGYTPLHWAAQEGHLQGATVLLEFGANMEARDDEGNTPRQLSRKSNHQQLVQLLT
ncbi:26S proteasome non-ATPase regulatory subunit 10-like [Schistocerca americana]|uniref:26S proteasome non-ATPase regulatory subunit 10-like n=1 Tax=Schistocerca americana TaxID=7009 RepID=UPI001F5012F6|nr:26S proteasome non-ATPase regulatory subunit 10-like [Schistocerca americana]